MPQFRYIGLAAIEARAHTALIESLNQAANDLVRRAVDVTPIEEGTLRASIQTDGAQATASGAEARVYTGGESSAYAAYIHEGHRADGSYVIRNYHGGGPKYIEGPLTQMGPAYIAYLRAAVAKAF